MTRTEFFGGVVTLRRASHLRQLQQALYDPGERAIVFPNQAGGHTRALLLTLQETQKPVMARMLPRASHTSYFLEYGSAFVEGAFARQHHFKSVVAGFAAHQPLIIVREWQKRGQPDGWSVIATENAAAIDLYFIGLEECPTRGPARADVLTLGMTEDKSELFAERMRLQKRKPKVNMTCVHAAAHDFHSCLVRL